MTFFQILWHLEMVNNTIFVILLFSLFSSLFFDFFRFFSFSDFFDGFFHFAKLFIFLKNYKLLFTQNLSKIFLTNIQKQILLLKCIPKIKPFFDIFQKNKMKNRKILERKRRDKFLMETEREKWTIDENYIFIVK